MLPSYLVLRTVDLKVLTPVLSNFERLVVCNIVLLPELLWLRVDTRLMSDMGRYVRFGSRDG